MEQRVRFSQRQSAVSYRYPLATTLISATTQAAAHSLGTVRDDNTIGHIKRLAVGNQGGIAVALTFYAIPSGGTIGAANREITALSIPGNSNVDLTDFIAGLYAPGTEFKAFAGMTNSLLIMGYVEGLL